MFKNHPKCDFSQSAYPPLTYVVGFRMKNYLGFNECKNVGEYVFITMPAKNPVLTTISDLDRDYDRSPTTSAAKS